MKSDSIKGQTLRGVIWSFADVLSRQGIQLIVQIVLARLLLPEHFGLIGMITIFIAISKSFVESGLDQALIREKQPTQADYSTVFYFNLLVSILIYIFLFVSAPMISAFFNEPKLTGIVRVLMIIIIINAFGVIQRVLLIREVDFKTQSKITIIAGTVSGVIAILFALNNLGIWSLVVQTAMLQLIEVLLLFYRSRWTPSLVFSVSSFKHFFDFGYKLLLSGLIETIYKNIFFVIIGKTYSAAQLGFYTNASKIADVSSGSIHLALGKVTYPVLSRIKDDQSRLSRNYKKLINMTSFLNFPLMMGLAAIAPNLIPFLLGNQWLPVVKYFQLLCFAGMILPINGFNLNILKVKGRTDLFLTLAIIRKIILTVLIFLAVILNIGIEGLIGAAIVDSYISFFIISYFSGKEISYRPTRQVKDMALSYVGSIIMALIVYYSGVYLNTFAFLDMLIQICLGVIIYIIFSIISRSNEFKEILKVLKIIKV